MSRMPRILGEDIGIRDFPEYVWNADLVYYDGPFISLYRRENGPDALYFWVDNDSYNNRWATIELSRLDLQKYLKSEISLLSIIQSSEICYIFNTGPKGRKGKISKLPSHLFPQEYLPDQDSYLYPEMATGEARQLSMEIVTAYQLGLDGEDIYAEDLATIPKIYQQLYSFHYGLSHIDRAAIYNKLKSAMDNWTGGISAVNLFSGLRNLIPSIHRARVSRLKYASPGFVQLELLNNLAVEIHSVTEKYLNNSNKIDKLYRDCYKYFRDQEISGFDNEDPAMRTPLSALQRSGIQGYLNQFYELLSLGAYDDQFAKLEVDVLGRLRGVLAYYRRIKILKRYIDSGTLTIPDPANRLAD